MLEFVRIPLLRGLAVRCQGFPCARLCIATGSYAMSGMGTLSFFHLPYLPFLVSRCLILILSRFISRVYAELVYIRVGSLYH